MSLLTGIDCAGENPLTAVVDIEPDRIRATALGRLEDFQPLSDDHDLAIALPDNEVIVKPIVLRDTDPGELYDRGKFELAAGLLELETQFDFDFITTAQSERFLGLVCRRALVESRKQRLLPNMRPEIASTKMRAAALVAGYLAFCRPDSGELLAVVDLGCDPISVSLIYRHRTIALGSLRNGFAYNTEPGLKHLAIELKTVLNFRLSALAEQGITTPLAKLLLCGEPATDRVIDSMAAWFPTGVGRPVFDQSRFDPPLLEDLESPATANYLVALGLTVR